MIGGYKITIWSTGDDMIKVCWHLIATLIHDRLLRQSRFKPCIWPGYFLLRSSYSMLETCILLAGVRIHDPSKSHYWVGLMFDQKYNCRSPTQLWSILPRSHLSLFPLFLFSHSKVKSCIVGTVETHFVPRKQCDQIVLILKNLGNNSFSKVAQILTKFLGYYE